MLPDIQEQFKGLSKTSNQFKILFLLRLTKEMIRNCETEDLDRLGSVLKKKRHDKKQRTKSYFQEKYPEHMPSMMYRHHQETRQYIEPPPPKFQEYAAIQERTQYPTQQRNAQLNLGRLNRLIQDPNIVSIDCPGPEENITIKGPQGTKIINLALTKDEINQILQVFSQVSRIPLEEGVVRIMVGRLNLSAVVSDVLGARFIIKKTLEPTRRF